jgi:hypothetical protein
MAEIKKFLDQSGVSTLWTKIAEEVSKVDAKVTDNAADILAHGTRLDAAEKAIAALEAGTYDDSEVRGLISANDTAIKANVAAIEVLNGDADTAGSVANTANAAAAAKVAEIVADADAKFDTLKEIADWILTDTTGAAGMAADIDALEAKLAGVDTTVVASIASAIDAALKVDGANKYALASNLNTLADRVKALEDAGYQNAEQVGSAIDTKIAALNLANSYDAKGAAATAESNAKAHADGLNTTMDTRVKVLEAIDHTKFEAAGAAAQALVDAKAHSDSNLAAAKTYSDGHLATAKSYTDEAYNAIQALTAAEIEAAIASVTPQA